MAQHGLGEAQAEVKRGVQALVRTPHEMLGDGLVGAYLHGSLAFGCFNPSNGPAGGPMSVRKIAS